MNWKFTLYFENMSSLTEPTKITGWEKWINRIVTIALAIQAAIQWLLSHWASNPNLPGQ
jgi:hypothetical protein